MTTAAAIKEAMQYDPVVDPLRDRVTQQESIIQNLKSQRDQQLEALRIKIVKQHEQIGKQDRQILKLERRLSDTRYELKNLRTWCGKLTETITKLRRRC